MFDLTEIEMRMLVELNEGWQDFPALLHKTTDRKGTMDEIVAAQEGMRNLVRRGLVVLEMSSGPKGPYAISPEEVEKEIEAIASHLTFVPETEMWSDHRSDAGPPYWQTPAPEMELTEAGEKEAERILEERGMWWWHPKRA